MRIVTSVLAVCLAGLTASVSGQISPCTGSTLNIVPGPAITVGGLCRPINVAPHGGAWNCVAVTPAAAAPYPDRDVYLQGASSVGANGLCDFVVANGHLGAVASGPGQIERYGSNTGQSLARLANYDTLTSTGPYSWSEEYSFGPMSVARVLQFQVIQPGQYQVQMVSPVGSGSMNYAPWMRWHLYDPGPDAAWRGKSTSIANGQMDSGVQTVTLGAGWHAFVAFKNNEPVTGANGFYRLNVSAVPNPQPQIGSVSPPATMVSAFGSPLALTVFGSGFVGGSVVRVNGNPIATSFVSGTQLSAQLPGSYRLSARTVSIDVTSPPPGGGASPQSIGFEVQNPAPSIYSLFPSVAAVTQAPGSLALTVSGGGFVGASVVRWNGNPLPTTLQSSGFLSASISNGLLGSPGQATITVHNPGPGGGTSPGSTFSIVYPRARITALSPSIVDPGSLPATLSIAGSGFLGGLTTVSVGGLPLTPTVVSSGLMTVSVPAALGASPGVVEVAVANPAPGGGGDAAQLSIGYASIPVGPVRVNPANGHRYYESLHPMSVTEAKALANCLEGHLATITSANEQNWINANFATNRLRWIGLERTSPGASGFRWVTGEPFGFSNWAPGEPNGQGNGEDAVVANWGPVFLPCPPGTLDGCWNDLPGAAVGYSVHALIEVAPGFQQNQPGATLVHDGNQGDVHAGARITKVVGDSLQVDASSTNAGMPWTFAITAVPISSLDRDGFITAGGQIVNVAVWHPSLVTVPGFQTPFAPFSVSLSLPVPLRYGVQMLVLSPSHPDGFELSAPFDVEVRSAASVVVAGPTQDDASTLVQLPAGWPQITFQGTAYDEFYVNSNGSVSFQGSDIDPTPSVAALLSGPPRLAGMWTDLSPLCGGVVEAVLTNDGATGFVEYEVYFGGVPGQDAGTTGINSFSMRFQPTQGTCSITGYNPDPFHASDTLVGMSGSVDPTNGQGYSFAAQAMAGGTQLGNPNQVVFEFRTGEEVPVGWSDIFFPASNGSQWMVFSRW